jgi:hypothetical protein
MPPAVIVDRRTCEEIELVGSFIDSPPDVGSEPG